MFDMMTGALKTTMLGHKDEIYSINVFDDERFMVSSSEDTSVKLWDLTRGRTLRTFFGIPNSFCIARHQSLIVMGDVVGSLKTWQIT
jgi:WD40 repeat protein